MLKLKLCSFVSYNKVELHSDITSTHLNMKNLKKFENSLCWQTLEENPSFMLLENKIRKIKKW